MVKIKNKKYLYYKIMAKKEVKNPRKPATKRVSKVKTTDKEVEGVVSVTESIIENINNEGNKIQDDTLIQEEQVIEPTETDPEPTIIDDTPYDDPEFYGSEEPEWTGDKDDEDLGPQDGENLDPQQVITEFTEATKNLDNIMASENPEDTLKEELKKVEEITEKLQEQIKKQEENVYKPVRNTWNGVSDGWYDY